MLEFNNIFYKKKVPESVAAKEPLADKVQPHGMALINFTLTEHMIEDKIA